MNPDPILVTTTISQTKQHFRHLSLDLPEGLLQGLSEADEAAALGFPRYDPVMLRDAVDAALRAGREVHRDKAVKDALERKALADANVRPLLEGLADQRRADALRNHAGQILDQLAHVVDVADATLADARRKVPDLDPRNPSTVIGMTPTQAAAWSAAQRAYDHLTRVQQLWNLLVRTCNLAPVNSTRGALILADLDGEAFLALDARNPMSVVDTGAHLELATPETYVQRCATIDNYLAAQREARQRELQTGMRESVNA